MAKRRGTKQNKRKTIFLFFSNIICCAFLLSCSPQGSVCCWFFNFMLFISLFTYLFYFILFFFFFFFTNSSEIHWFIHSRGFAVQFGRNHVLSTKKTLQITVKVFFYLPNILYHNELLTGSISRYILYICRFSFFLGHNELQAESNTDKARHVIPVLNATSINISLLNAINLF